MEFVNNTSANTLKPCLERIFSRYGIPETIISDNISPFTSHKLKEFMIQNSITQKDRTAMASSQPRSGEVSGTTNEEDVYKFLFAYRSTPHSSTKVATAELIFNSNIRYTIPNIRPQKIYCRNKQTNSFIDNRKNNTMTHE